MVAYAILLAILLVLNASPEKKCHNKFQPGFRCAIYDIPANIYPKLLTSSGAIMILLFPDEC